MNQYGHYGKPAMRLAVLAGLALIIHFVVPYGVIAYDGPAAPDNEVLSRGEANDRLPGVEVATNASPDLVFGGIMVAIAGAVILVAQGFRPLSVAQARWSGAAGAAVALVGAGLMWMPSLYAAGSGFASMLTMMFGGDFRTNFFAISPVLIAVMAVVMAWDAFAVARQVVMAADGVRDQLAGRQRHAFYGMAWIGLVALVPWSIGLLPDGASDAIGVALPYDEDQAFFFSAEDIQGTTPEERAGFERYGGEEEWGTIKAAIHLQLALGWTLFVAAIVHGLLATAASVGVPGLLRAVPVMEGAAALLLLPVAVLYLLAWILVDPFKDPGHTFLPGFFPALILPLFYLVGRRPLAALLAKRSGSMLAAEPE